MKLKKILSLLILLIAMSSFGQDRKKSDQIKSLKVAFITSELNLTPDESARFWPLYNEFESKQRAMRRNTFAFNRKQNSKAQLTEKEAQAILASIEREEEAIHQNQKKFYKDLRNILPAVKILKLRKAELDFNKKLLRQYRQRKSK